MAVESKSTSAVLKKSTVVKEKIIVAADAVKKVKVRSSYPPIPIMVNAAIKELKEHNGSSVHAIRKYLAETYKATSDIVYAHMKKYLRSGVKEGKLVQTRGHGAYGSFRLPPVKKSKTVNKPAAVNKSSIKPQNKAVAVPKKKNDAKKPKAVVVKKIATGIKKAKTTKKPASKKNRPPFKIVLKVKPTKSKTSTVKNIKTPKSRSASKN